MLRDAWIAVASSVAGIVLLVAGSVLPARLRSVDRDVVRVAAEGTPSLVSVADRFLAEDRVGPAALLLRSAELFDKEAVAPRLAQLKQRLEAQPALARWGGPNPWLDRYLAGVVKPGEEAAMPVLDWLLPAAGRASLLSPLASSSDPAVTVLLACRRLEVTEILPPVPSASGQPLDAAILLAATMVQVPRAHAGLALDLERAAMSATQGRGSAPLEGMLLDMLAAARRLDWEQLATLLEYCEDGSTLHHLVASAGGEGERWNSLFSLVVVGSSGRDVAAYLRENSNGGLDDLNLALGMGEGAVREVLRRGQRIHEPRLREWGIKKFHLESRAAWLAGITYRAPGFAMAGKILLWLDGLFLLVLGLWYGRRAALDEWHPNWRSRPDFGVLAVLTGTMGIVLFLASERFLVLKYGTTDVGAADSQPVIRARLRLDLPPATSLVMNEKVVGMLAAFFAVQFAIYLIGLSRVRSIRNQAVEDGVKLKLLDNEETVFDAPLYIGIGGSVLALVLRLTGFGDVSLMASYSSTLFGILFCFVLKVMHVRPYRQQLILQSNQK